MTQSKNDEFNMNISINGIPKITNMSKKELDLFIACLELEIREFYLKEKNESHNIPP